MQAGHERITSSLDVARVADDVAVLRPEPRERGAEGVAELARRCGHALIYRVDDRQRSRGLAAKSE